MRAYWAIKTGILNRANTFFFMLVSKNWVGLSIISLIYYGFSKQPTEPLHYSYEHLNNVLWEM